MTGGPGGNLASVKSILIGLFFVAFAAYSLSVKLDLRLGPEVTVAEQYGIRTFPTTFQVNSDGEVERVI